MTRMSATISRSTTDHGRRTAATRMAISTDVPARTAGGPAQQAHATCPTCLAATESCLDVLPGATHPGVRAAQCPTCGVTSIEYGLVLAIDAVLVDMTGLERVAAAL